MKKKYFINTVMILFLITVSIRISFTNNEERSKNFHQIFIKQLMAVCIENKACEIDQDPVIKITFDYADFPAPAGYICGRRIKKKEAYGIKNFWIPYQYILYGAVFPSLCEMSKCDEYKENLDIIHLPTSFWDWRLSHQASYDRIFQKYFKRKIIKKIVKYKVFDENSKTIHVNNFVYYNPVSLQKALSKLYRRPDDCLINDIAFQAVYNSMFKRYINNEIKKIIYILSQEKTINQKTAQYIGLLKKKAYSNYCMIVTMDSDLKLAESFNYDKLRALCNDESQPRFYNDNERCAEMTLFLMRRKADRTLPVLLGFAKKVLREYDPVYFRSVNKKFMELGY